MRLLLDTHVLLWALHDPDELSPRAREALVDPTHVVYVSSATVWEASIKQALGKLRGADDLPAKIREQRFDELPIELEHAALAGELPRHHADPFDRMLVAQATCEGLTIVTRDERISRDDVPVLAA